MATSTRTTAKFLALAALWVAGCNIFNPSGEGDGGESTDAYLAEGGNRFRDQDYAAAMEAYQKAIEQDSTSSLAYYGYAKATLRHYRLNASTILAEVDSASATQSIPFLNADEAKLTRYLQATSKVRRALSHLTSRDTLTRWWRYTRDSASNAARKDAFRDKRISFIRGFIAEGEQGRPGYYPSQSFPLSDGALPYEKVVIDYGFIELLYTLVHLRDLDQNDTIDSRDDLLTRLNFKTEGGFKLDSLQNIAEELQNDTATLNNFNNLIQNVQSGLGSASQVIGLLVPTSGSGTGEDTLSNQQLTDAVSGNVDSVINSLGSAIGFYQFGDGRDNDGDGCADEEMLDGKDNDLDGFTDEDARVIKDMPDLVDNDHNGEKDMLDPGESLGEADVLGFVLASGFIQGAKYKDKEIKVQVQADSLASRPTLTPAQAATLALAKSQIGGCWNNY